MAKLQFSTSFSRASNYNVSKRTAEREKKLSQAMLSGEIEKIEKWVTIKSPYLIASALYMASDLGLVDAIKLFLPHYKGNNFGRDAYQRAVAHGHLECLKLLSTVYPNTAHINGLNTAIAMGHFECARWLMPFQETILPLTNLSALIQKDIRFLQILITEKNPPTENLLVRAASQGRLDCVSFLLPLLDKKDLLYSKALVASADEGHTEIVKFLLENSNIDPKMDDSEALHFASLSGYLDCVKALFPVSDPSVFDEDIWIEMDPECREWMKAEMLKLKLEKNTSWD